MNKIEFVKNYFLKFSEKDIYSLEEMFHINITLRDWEICAEGMLEVIEANKKIFSSCDSILVKPLNIWENSNHIIAELEILINGKEQLKVIDLFEFKNEKIISIKAFKG